MISLLLLRAGPAQVGLADSTAEPSTLELGRAVYDFRCYYCHGYSGDARTLASSYLEPPPRDFTKLDPEQLSRESMIATVRDGRSGTAMMAFGSVLAARELAAVVDFVRSEFMTGRREDTGYHTLANGWPDHERYRIAYPFATGEIGPETPWETLSEEQRRGRQLFYEACISCHDATPTREQPAVWERQAISYPRFGFGPRDLLEPPDAWSGASGFARHDRKPVLPELSAVERTGEGLYQENCAFCHAADGTGRNWIGSFLQPRPRDLTDPGAMAGMTRERIRAVIHGGLPGTSMPAWGSVLEPQQIEAIIEYLDAAFHPLPEAATTRDAGVPSD